MALLKQWRDMAYDQEANKGDIQRFWAKYFDIEKEEWAASKAVLRKQGIFFTRLKKYNTNCGVKVYCCYDEERNVFYTGIIDEGEILLSALNRAEAERVFIDLKD